MTASEYAKRWRVKKANQGLCVCCGREKAVEGYVCCKACNDKKRSVSEAARKKRLEKCKNLGMCFGCGKPMDKSGLYCSTCTKKNAEYTMQYRKMLKKLNLCVSCGEYTDGKTYCEVCRDKYNASRREKYAENREHILALGKQRREEYKKQGLCPDCRRPITDKRYVLCSRCRAKARAKRERAKEYKYLCNALQGSNLDF